MADKGKETIEKILKKGGGKGAGIGIGLVAAMSAGAYALYNSVYTGLPLGYRFLF